MSAALRILVIRRNRMGDMICTLPLLRHLRRAYPHAHLAVACDAPGLAIAQACPEIDEVILLNRGWNRWVSLATSALALRSFDWVLAAKGGFDRRLAILTRLTGAKRRIGFARTPELGRPWFTDIVSIPEQMWDVHQIDAMLLLLQPLGLAPGGDLSTDLALTLPASAVQFRDRVLHSPPFSDAPGFRVVNLSSTVANRFPDADYAQLISRMIESAPEAIAVVAAPADQPRAAAIVAQVKSPRVAAIATPSPLDLAALLEQATLFITPEGGAAHLAACMRTPALVLWFEGPFAKWRSTAPNHTFVRLLKDEPTLPPNRVWAALAPSLHALAP